MRCPLTLDSKLTTGYLVWRYVRSLAGRYAWLFYLQAFLGLHFTEIILSFQLWYLGYWASQYEKHSPSEVNVFRYMAVYSTHFVLIFMRPLLKSTSGSMPLAAISVFSISNVIYYSGVVGASKKIHQQLVRSILGATFRYVLCTRFNCSVF